MTDAIDIVTTGMDRRDFLRLALLAVAGGSGLAGCEPFQRLAPVPDAMQPANYIDAHCHIFNGADVPIEGFIARVVATESEFVQVLDALRFIRLAAAVVQGNAASVAKENTRIDQFGNTAALTLVAPFDEKTVIGAGLRALKPPVELAASMRRVRNYFHYRTALGARVDLTTAAGAAATSDDTLVSLNIDALLMVYRLFGQDKIAPQLQAMENDIQARTAKGTAADGDLAARYTPLLSNALGSFDSAYPAIQEQIEATRVPEAGSSLPFGGWFQSVNELRYEIAYGLRWAAGYTKCRVDLADQLQKLYPASNANSGRPRVRLYFHALLDYDCWVDPHAGTANAQTKVPLEDQMKLAGRISRLSLDGAHFHGFYPFDPLRAVMISANQAQFGRHPLALLKEAIGEHGFIGAKIYPPMGFAPYGNTGAEISGNFGPLAGALAARYLGETFDLGRALDEELLAFYDYCAENQIPILTHTSGSQYSFAAAADRIAPSYWKTLLDKVRTKSGRPLRDLRLNLGHLGGFWCLGKSKSSDLSGNVCKPLSQDETSARFDGNDALLDQTWTAAVVAMLAKDQNGARPYPHVYADIADVSSVADPFERAQRAAMLTHFATVLRRKGISAFDRIMYGTDWSLLGRSVDYEDYYRGTIAFLAELSGKLGLAETMPIVENVMWANASAFFGLDKGGATRSRLEAFYAANNVAMPDWTAFDVLPPPVVGPR